MMRWILAVLQFPVMSLATCLAFARIAFWTALNRQSQAYEAVRSWCRLLHRITRTRYVVEGLERVPDGPYVVISNHSSHLDGPGLIVTLPDPIYFVIKKGLAQIPVWGWAAKRIGFIAIDRARSSTAQKTLNEAVTRVKNGTHVLVFAEGTRAPDHRLHRFKKGGFHLAVEAGVPILPVAINGSRTLLPKGSFTPRPGTVRVIVGHPVDTEGMTRDDLPELIERTRNEILAGRRRDPDFIDDSNC